MALDILKIVIGGVIGIIGKILYDFLNQRREKKRISELISVEMLQNIQNVKKLHENVKYLTSGDESKELQLYSLEETADKINESRKKDIYNKCLEKISLLGRNKMEIILEFYDSFDDEEKFIREYARFGGNISHYASENVVSRLLNRIQKSFEEFKK
jgi:hypothetical protein